MPAILTGQISIKTTIFQNKGFFGVILADVDTIIWNGECPLSDWQKKAVKRLFEGLFFWKEDSGKPGLFTFISGIDTRLG
jgi:hypothetical protein